MRFEPRADAIELSNVSRWYGPVIGLNDVSLRIGSGVTGLLGPNGAGKSTLLRLVTGQISASLGDVRVLGEPMFQNPNVLARVGCCPDLEKFNDEWTGLAFVRAAAFFCGFSSKAAHDRALALLELVGLADAANRVIGSYSKGMRQRVKLAQALVNDPELIIFDEPLTGMDPVGRRKMVDLIRAFGAEGRTIVVSSHVLHEVEAMTDNVVLIHHGRVLAEGRVHEIRSLLKGYPHHIRIELEGADPGRRRALAERLVASVDLVGLRFDDDGVTVETTTPEPLFRTLEGLVLDDGFAVRKLYARDDSLEAVFDYLVR